jgi:hypothetical protein
MDPGGRVDEALLLAAALDEIEGPHVKLLGTLLDAGHSVEAETMDWST